MLPFLLDPMIEPCPMAGATKWFDMGDGDDNEEID
jgi:hypothetical protein